MWLDRATDTVVLLFQNPLSLIAVSAVMMSIALLLPAQARGRSVLVAGSVLGLACASFAMALTVAGR